MNTSTARAHRAPIYSHFCFEGDDVYACQHCGTRTKSGGSSSNLHKHLIKAHPEVNRTKEFMLATDDAQITIVNLPEDIEETKHVPTPCPQPQKKRPKLETPTPATLNQSRHVNKAEILESRLAEEPVMKTEADRLSMKILKKMKQMNTDLANLENQLLEQQFESQSQRQLIEDLQKQVRQLKRSAKTPGNSNPSELNSMFEFPLCRMSDIDQMEEQITSDPEVKESLARFFQMGQADKMDSILSWFSHELLMQFTCRTDRESLATHRSTDLSEIFQLMYTTWATDGFNKKDFNSIVRAALEVAACRISTENSERNKTKSKAQHNLDYDSADDDHFD